MTGIKITFIIHKVFTSVVSEYESLCGLQRFSFPPLESQPYPWINAKTCESMNNVMQEKNLFKNIEVYQYLITTLKEKISTNLFDLTF